MRFTTKLSTLALMASLAAPAALAQSTPTPTPAAAAPQGDPVVASVNGMKIHFSDVQADAQDIPQQMQQMPPNQLFRSW